MKNFYRTSIALLIILTSHLCQAQQDPMYTQYMFNISSVNAAAIGRGDNISLMMVDRFQWVGFEGAPKTVALTADVPIKFFNSGVGLTYVNDRIDIEQTNNLYLDYAYHINLTPKIKMGMGLKAGFKVYSANYSDMQLEEDNDSQFEKNIYGDFMPNFGLGLFVYADNFYFGASSPKLVNHKYEGTEKVSGGEERHYFLIGGYVQPINEDLVFKPTIAAKFVNGSRGSLDITANFLYKNMLWAGLGYRSGDAITFLTSVKVFNQFRVGYAYDITVSKMRTISSGSHEIMLSYEFKSFKDKMRSPRYF